MGEAIAMIMKIKENKRKKKASGGNRRERKLKNKMKVLRQVMARTGKELYRRNKHGKATKKEKDILKDLKAKIRNQQLTDQELSDARYIIYDKNLLRAVNCGVIPVTG